MHTAERILIKVDCKVESSAEEPNPPGLIRAQTYISAVELVGMILDKLESWNFHGGDGRERSSSSAWISLPLSLSLETRCRRTRPPFGKNEETQQHTWSRHHHHLQEIRTRPKSGPKWKWVAKSLGNGIATHLAAGAAGVRV